MKGYPTLKIIRNEGQSIEDYKGPRDAEGIVEFLKKQVGPASSEIKSSDDAISLLDGKKVFIVRPYVSHFAFMYLRGVCYLFFTRY